MTYLNEKSDEKKEPLTSNLLKQRLSLASFIIGVVSVGVFSWLSWLLFNNVQIWISDVWGLTITCIFSAITVTGLLLGIVSLKKGKRIFAILGCVFNGIMIGVLGWAIYVFIHFMTMEPMTG
jgi:hypothetical protein